MSLALSPMAPPQDITLGAVLTEIYLYNVFACQESLRRFLASVVTEIHLCNVPTGHQARGAGDGAGRRQRAGGGLPREAPLSLCCWPSVFLCLPFSLSVLLVCSVVCMATQSRRGGAGGGVVADCRRVR
jgi:hypothetical protein